MAISTVAAIGLGLAAAGTYMSYQQSKKAASAQKESMRLQQRRAELQAARQRRQQYQQSRIARAAMLAGASGGPTVDLTQTSSFVGGRGAVGTQAGANVAFLNQDINLAKQQSIFNMSAVDYQSKASMWSGVASLGTLGFQAGGGFTGGGQTTAQVQPQTTNTGFSQPAWFSPVR